jgi:hypothetical protein
MTGLNKKLAPSFPDFSTAKNLIGFNSYFRKGDNVINNRQNFRLRKQFNVTWSIPDQKLKGEGKVFNISLSGMQFVTDVFEVREGQTIHFSVAQIPAFPSKGKLAWFRKIGQKQSQYQCGVKFVKEATYNPKWTQWMEDNISKMGDAEDTRVLNRMIEAGEDS